jgi:hypothetical protein
MTPEALRKEIIAAFPIGTPPVDPIRSDVYESVHDGVAETRAAFLGKTWTQVDFSDASNYGFLEHAMVCLTFDAFSYYFPSLLYGFVEEDGQRDSFLFGTFLGQLNPQSASEQMQNFFLALTSQQSAVVADFLEYVWQRDNEIDAMLALENFWDVYLSADRRKAIAESDAAKRIYKTFGWTQKA